MAELRAVKLRDSLAGLTAQVDGAKAGLRLGRLGTDSLREELVRRCRRLRRCARRSADQTRRPAPKAAGVVWSRRKRRLLPE